MPAGPAVPDKTVLRDLGATVAGRNQVEVVMMLNFAAVDLGTDAYVSAQAVRGNTVVATVATKDDEVLGSPTIQDLGYRFASSGRVLPTRLQSISGGPAAINDQPIGWMIAAGASCVERVGGASRQVRPELGHERTARGCCVTPGGR